MYKFARSTVVVRGVAVWLQLLFGYSIVVGVLVPTRVVTAVVLVGGTTSILLVIDSVTLWGPLLIYYISGSPPLLVVVPASPVWFPVSFLVTS